MRNDKEMRRTRMKPPSRASMPLLMLSALRDMRARRKSLLIRLMEEASITKRIIMRTRRIVVPILAK